MSEVSITVPAEQMSNIFGNFDENMKALENKMNVMVVNRGEELIITGDQKACEEAASVIAGLSRIAGRGEDVTLQHVNYLMSLTHEERSGDNGDWMSDIVTFTRQGKPVRPKTIGQKKYVDLIRQNMLTFAIGPAGTGKTYLAMAMAIQAFKSGDVNRIILTRPAIEAGERLGFLPGDLQSKIDPYLRPLYDALYDIMGAESFQKNLEKGAIEVAPLAYMRGRTLDNSFIVLDEAQNTTQAQMKMFLTRIGFQSKAVITGDLTQVDLPGDQKSGLRQATAILRGIEGIGIVQLRNQDVVRHPLVQKIVEAYERNEKQAEAEKERRNFVAEKMKR